MKLQEPTEPGVYWLLYEPTTGERATTVIERSVGSLPWTFLGDDCSGRWCHVEALSPLAIERAHPPSWDSAKAARKP